MKKTILGLGVCLTLMMVSCGGNETTSNALVDSTAVDSVAKIDTPVKADSLIKGDTIKVDTTKQPKVKQVKK